MGGVPGFDPVTEHGMTRSALRAVVPRLVRLLGEVPDPGASSGAPVWTVGDVGAHLAAVYLAYCSIVSADGSVEWGTVLPPGDAPFTERIAAMNAKSTDLLGGDGHARTRPSRRLRRRAGRDVPAGHRGPRPGHPRHRALVRAEGDDHVGHGDRSDAR
ncbi:hypothetical protein ACFU98_37675 [Streptomyces sp. NPDC057575]|uniref:hypothetical protein n=1 Tax=unclassified Streptomyces TaxID=2593676 RepID=UPI00367C989A